MDNELSAIYEIGRILEMLPDVATRLRVLVYLSDKYSIEKAPVWESSEAVAVRGGGEKSAEMPQAWGWGWAGSP